MARGRLLPPLPERLQRLVVAELIRSQLQQRFDDPNLYARDPKAFADASAALAAAQSQLAAAEEKWLELEMLREEIEGS